MTIQSAPSYFDLTRPSARRITGLLAVITIAVTGCAGDSLDQRDLGNTVTELASDTPASGDRTPVVGAEGWIDPFIVGHWIGRAENPFAPSTADGARPIYTFPSGSSDITLDLTLDDPTYPNGQIVFGAGPVPVPQHAVVYPPGFQPSLSLPSSGSAEVPLAPLEGLAYTLFESVLRSTSDDGVAAGTLALGYTSNAAYVDWCPLQSPRYNGDGGYDCAVLSESTDPVEFVSTIGPDGTEERFDGDLYDLCRARNVCECTETDCSLATGRAHHIWLIRDGEDLLGTLVGAVFDYGSPSRFMPVGTVRFQRADR